MYITFDIGDNCGNILDYLKEESAEFYYLSLYLHDLPHQGKNRLFQYRKGQLAAATDYFTPRKNILSIYLNFFRLIFSTIWRIKNDKIIVTMNPYFATASWLFKFLGIKKIIFVVGDSPFLAQKSSWKDRVMRRLFLSNEKNLNKYSKYFFEE